MHKTHTQKKSKERKHTHTSKKIHMYTQAYKNKKNAPTETKKNTCTLKHKQHAQIKNISNRQYNLCINIPTRLIFSVVEISSTQVIPRGGAA